MCEVVSTSETKLINDLIFRIEKWEDLGRKIKKNRKNRNSPKQGVLTQKGVYDSLAKEGRKVRGVPKILTVGL